MLEISSEPGPLAAAAENTTEQLALSTNEITRDVLMDVLYGDWITKSTRFIVYRG